VSPVHDSDVEARLLQEQKRVARSVDVTDRPVETGDEVTLDYSGTVDGVAFDGGTAEDQKLVIGSGSFIPGFEEQLAGLSIGEEKDLPVTFPAEYHAEELKGKAAVFHVKVKAITREELPPLDDDFASEVSDFDTLADFSADIRAKLQKTADDQATEAVRQSLVQKVVDTAEVDIPAPMVEEKVHDLLNEMDWRMQQQGFDMKRYMQLTGQTHEQMHDMYREEARNNLKTELVIEEIIKAENVAADEADVAKMVDEYAKAVGKSAEDFRAGLNESQLAYFTHRAKVNRVLDLLWESATVTDETPAQADGDKPAKKPAARKAARKAAGDQPEAAVQAEADSEEPKKAAKPKAKPAAKKKAGSETAE
jgi:trigger factor